MSVLESLLFARIWEANMSVYLKFNNECEETPCLQMLYILLNDSDGTRITKSKTQQ